MNKEKYCYKCNIKQSCTNFHKNKNRKDGLQTVCISCRKLWDREIYKNTDKRHKNTIRREKVRDELRGIKSKIGCLFCNEKEGVCLDFHHTDDNKEFSIAGGSFGRTKTMKEILKCVVLCSNCHRKLHAGILQIPNEGFNQCLKDKQN